ncbi:hypothetical protein ACERK3_02300 [Phycisphaerales bacterium AB-hyl4]|uniref:Uncharacterized protein n=1 Tax=Natronomicrosphaera hydrolytica TaxID=3242702 RepID=A0ABV4U2N2_9BACT
MFINGATAAEFENRTAEARDRLRAWEDAARAAANSPESYERCRDLIERGCHVELVDRYGEDIREQFNDVMDYAEETADYLRSLAWMVNAKIGDRNQTTPEPSQQTESESGKPVWTFSDECDVVRWGDHTFTFTPMQAKVVAALKERYDNGTPQISEVRIGSKVDGGDEFRISKTFRNTVNGKKVTHPALGTMIAKDGTHYSLVPPESPDNPAK